MGRKPTVNLSIPPHMRARVQRSGKTYFYFDTGARPRKEISLGSDFILALDKYAELNTVVIPEKGTLFSDVIAKYETDALPKLAANTRKMYRSDIKRVQAASDLLGHDSVKTTQRHYLRRGKIVAPTK